jgi:hypothetical protein
MDVEYYSSLAREDNLLIGVDAVLWRLCSSSFIIDFATFACYTHSVSDKSADEKGNYYDC